MLVAAHVGLVHTMTSNRLEWTTLGLFCVLLTDLSLTVSELFVSLYAFYN